MDEFVFTDLDIAELHEWQKHRDWVATRMPVPSKFVNCKEGVKKAWHIWLFLCGALQGRLEKISPDTWKQAVENKDNLFSLTGSVSDSEDSQKTFNLHINSSEIRTLLGLPESITKQSRCPYRAYIKFISEMA